MGSAAEKQLAIFTLRYLTDKYDESQLRAVPDMPYHTDRRLMNMLRSIVIMGKVSRHAFSNVVGNGSQSQDLIGDDMIIFLTSSTVVDVKEASR